jgi:hypothetical protein
MTPAALLADLRRRGVTFAASATGLRYRAIRGVLTDADRAALREHRDALRALIVVLEVFPAATVDPTAGAGRTGAWPARWGPVPPDFDRLVPAREWTRLDAPLAADG